MKELKSKKEIIAYAMSFVSFVIPKISGIKEIILFGSVARGESDKNSDVDLFFDVEKNSEEKNINTILKNELNKFNKSKSAETFFLKGINNNISIHVGILKEWKLKRSIISEGIVLFGAYKETPKDIIPLVLFNVSPIKNIAKRNKVIRYLFGRKEKEYFSEGIIQRLFGKKLSPSSFLIPKEHTDKIISFLGKEKINYSFFEIWTDQIT